MTLQDCVVQRIYRLLIQMDWTMKQLSEQCGIPLAELESLMKRETADWTLEQLCTICRAFSISLPEFFDAPMFQRLFLPETHNSCYFFVSIKNRQDRCISYNEKVSVLPILCILVEKQFNAVRN